MGLFLSLLTLDLFCHSYHKQLPYLLQFSLLLLYHCLHLLIYHLMQLFLLLYHQVMILVFLPFLFLKRRTCLRLFYTLCIHQLHLLELLILLLCLFVFLGIYLQLHDQPRGRLLIFCLFLILLYCAFQVLLLPF